VAGRGSKGTPDSIPARCLGFEGNWVRRVEALWFERNRAELQWVGVDKLLLYLGDICY
jgi:hypothetical protein